MASALVHLSALGLLLLFSEVHPFGKVTAEPIAVELVRPDEVTKKPEQNEKPQLPSPKDAEALPQETAAAETAAAPAPQAAPASEPTPPSPEQAARPAEPDHREAALQPQPALPPPASPTPPPPQPAYTPPQPDITVKYGVMLGLPDMLPVASSNSDKPGDGIDATASAAADIASSLVAKFREHLKSCAKLPASVSRSDKVFVKLRVVMTPQARLAAEPILIEGTASTKALDLKQSAVRALNACQPYTMLPVDRYGEWKVLDLSFTPKDFA
jgi:hypothetical protein